MYLNESSTYKPDSKRGNERGVFVTEANSYKEAVWKECMQHLQHDALDEIIHKKI